MTDFHNPYNFVPALPRDDVKGELGDRSPIGHSIYADNHWSGTLTVNLITKTPLLIPHIPSGPDNGHKTYGLRMVGDKPYLPPTSIKGMLRAAYEAVTNSRLSVFVGHTAQLGYRMSTKTGLRMVPARIENEAIRLFPGISDIKQDGTPDGPMYAAWLPRYNEAVKYPSHQLPQHGEKVKAYCELIQHHKWDTDRHVPDFQYLRVLAIVPEGDTLSKPELTVHRPPRNYSSYHKPLKQCIEISGYVCVTNPNISRKHDERVFFDTLDEPLLAPLTLELKEQWRDLIDNYHQEHRDEICVKRRTGPPALRSSIWSRHITHGHHQIAESEKVLTEGSLCYALVDYEQNEPGVLGLYPVMISRELFDLSPIDLLHVSLRPAKAIKFLSPADRVFGWVRQNSEEKPADCISSYKGQLRIHSVECISPNAIQDDFGQEQDGFPLAILGQPKPQQSRFYAAQNEDGKPFDDGVAKSKGYKTKSQGLRGRKVYPHHKDLPNDHWSSPQNDRTQQLTSGHYQEYRRPKKDGQEQRDDQNRSIKAWVKEETKFTFSIDVTNLSDVELGALLYLLTLEPEHYHRLGGGKSLGFGSVRLELDKNKSNLKNGQALRHFYRSLIPEQTSDVVNWKGAISHFKEAITQEYKKSFSRVSFIAAFEQAAKGYSGSVHYPRTNPAPKPDGESFKWFVENEAPPRGKKLALPDLTSNQKLPLNPTNVQKPNQSRRRR